MGMKRVRKLCLLVSLLATSVVGEFDKDVIREWTKNVESYELRQESRGVRSDRHEYSPSVVPTGLGPADTSKLYPVNGIRDSPSSSYQVHEQVRIELPKVDNTGGIGIKRYRGQYAGEPLKILGSNNEIGRGRKKKPIPGHGSRPHILVFLTDDLGYHDVGYAENPREMSLLATPFMSKLAKETGIILSNHYVHWHCSPSRRSFLTGRLPIHVGGDNLTHFSDDDMDMRFTWVSEKLKTAGYTNLFYGKGHIGTRSVKMLPAHRGFDHHSGFLSGSQSYKSSERWVNFGPSKASEFSTQLWGESMYDRMKELLKNPEKRIFLYASWQTPHSPLQAPPGKYKKPKKAMNLLDWNMFALDVEMNRIVSLFSSDAALWDNTLVVFISDNGGTTKQNYGNNWPLRSEKGSSFEGAFRGTGFVSGGIVPQKLRGTTNSHTMHIADWYATFCKLAGVSAKDDSQQPLAYPNAKPADVVDPQFPSIVKKSGDVINVYGDAYPSVDSRDIWPVLMRPDDYPLDELHRELPLSNEAFLFKGRYKLVLAQPCSKGILDDKDCKVDADMGWVSADRHDRWEKADPSLGCLQKFDDRLGPNGIHFRPCLFDIRADPSERVPLDNPDLLDSIWEKFNRTLVFQYNTHLAGKHQGVSPPECAGSCDVSKVKDAFGIRPGSNIPAPYCGLDSLTDTGKIFC